jgi:hypothetical protein
MTVAELIRELEKMPQDKKVLMFDGPSYYTPSTVYESDKYGKDKEGNVILLKRKEYDNLCQVRDWLIMLNEMRDIIPVTGQLNSNRECATYDESNPSEVTYLGVVNKFDWKEPIK